MKKIYLFCSLAIMYSCSDSIIPDKNPESKPLVKNELLTISPVSNTNDFVPILSRWSNKTKGKQTILKSEEHSELKDLIISQIKVSYLPDLNIIFSLSDINKYQYMAYLEEKNEIVNQLYVNLEENDSCYTVKYYDVINNNNFEISINKENGILIQNSLRSGQGVANCVSDAYTNHGWASVFISIETACIWQTMVAVAADCAIHQF